MRGRVRGALLQLCMELKPTQNLLKLKLAKKRMLEGEFEEFSVDIKICSHIRIYNFFDKKFAKNILCF